MKTLALFILAAVWGTCLSARTPEEFRSDITARDRQITELHGEVERLRYAAGDQAARSKMPGTPAAVTIAQHAETVKLVGETSEELKGIRQLVQAQKDASERRNRNRDAQAAAAALAQRLQVMIACVLVLNTVLIFLKFRMARNG